MRIPYNLLDSWILMKKYKIIKFAKNFEINIIFLKSNFTKFCRFIYKNVIIFIKILNFSKFPIMLFLLIFFLTILKSYTIFYRKYLLVQF